MPERKIKVAILSFYSGLVSRGVETFVTEISKRVKVTVYHAVRLPAPGNKLHYFFLDPPSLAIRKFTLGILEKLEADPPDVIMAFNNGWMSWLAKRFCQNHKTKLILAGFSGIGWDDKVNLWLKPDCFVACTKYQAKWARKINRSVRVETINIGVNIERFRPEGKKFLHGLKPPVVLVVAGPEPAKRVHLAVRAVSQIRASLLVVGNQPSAVNHLAKKLLGKRYKNVLVDYDRLDSVYRSADVYTLPSVSGEAYGISILEAMASGLPVVVNDDPIRRELAGEAGIYTDPTDLTGYSGAIQLSLSSRKRYREQALKFSWEKISRQWQELWSDLIS